MSARAAGAEARAERLFTDEERWARRAQTRANVTWWDASISGKASAYRKMASAERALNRHYSRPAAFRRVARLAADTRLDRQTRRRLERVRNAYRGRQAPPDLLDGITAASTALAEQYGTFRAVFEGERTDDNVVEEVLRTTADSDRARTAWEARKQIGAAVGDDVRRLAEQRNEAARAIGFPDFWHQQLELEELSPERLLQTLEAVDAATREPFARMKQDLDRHLAARFNLETSALRPWHYGDPFFQKTPDVFAPPADPLYANMDVVELSAQTYRELGFLTIDAILGRSDLYPRPGKNQHAYAVDIDREGDVRTFLNVERNARWMGTLLHELGHTIYADGLDRKRLPYDLRDDPQGFLNEGFAMFCEQPMFEPTWLASMVGLPRDEAERLAPRLLAQETSALLAFVRWCLVIVTFEHALYADPSQDLNTLWWDLVERHQRLTRPEGRNQPDWATKIHVATAPVYYHKYLYGRLFSAQLHERLNQQFGGWWNGRPRTGDYIKQQLFGPGATYPWTELVERVTGQPLGVHALGRAVAWPV